MLCNPGIFPTSLLKLNFGSLLQCRFPASVNPAIFAAQQTMVEAWTIVGETFVDSRFAGHNWDHELTEHLNAAYTAETGENAYREIGHMLAKLGDPFTRVVPARYATARTTKSSHWMWSVTAMAGDTLCLVTWTTACASKFPTALPTSWSQTL